MLGRPLKLWVLVSFLITADVLAWDGIADAQGQQTLIVALGASNTAGQGVAPDKAYPAQLQALLRAKGRVVQVRNAGVGGDTASGILSRLDTDVPEGTRLVLLQIGSNDLRNGSDRASVHENVERIFETLKMRHIMVIRIDPLIGRMQPSLRQSDGIHLTAEGYRDLANSLLPSVMRATR